MDKGCVLGIDTSNYKTSLAVVDRSGKIIKDARTLLAVKQGTRGLRQSEAFFQHIENFPNLINQVFEKTLSSQIAAVAVSDKPRPIEGSYMPCFKAGISFAQSIAKILQVPVYCFSHQEGHIEAVKAYSHFNNEDTVLAWHLSGGTCELLKVDNHLIEIIGGSKDISFGQVLDRIGVLYGLNFPCGEAMDVKVCGLRNEFIVNREQERLTKIKLDGLSFNLSGVETQCARWIQSENDRSGEFIPDWKLIKELFDQIADCIILTTQKASEKTGIRNVIFAGGVSSSKYISERIIKAFENTAVQIDFGNQELASDNAVGVALLGGKSLWL
ncbi:DNA-binding protein [Clostridium aminobutyricum]|uniref:N(6)-L-threonylcarbamoyladenine synthase n=1 Tax=Clostridium aminobutyricum TaxID=33953 RepID=A0A939D6Q0_CLOAM|nr:DNA-binding protein [Clostridium aminobutyricum]MBN7772524.1 DNA-binding protein [Clostridium aminobutyricum]